MGYGVANKVYRRKKPENAVRYQLSNARHRAKKRGLAFTIALEDLLPLPTRCPVFKTLLVYDGERGNPNSFSLDRRDNNLGYTPGNVVIISLRANQLKRDASLEELKAIVKYMKGRWRG